MIRAAAAVLAGGGLLIACAGRPAPAPETPSSGYLANAELDVIAGAALPSRPDLIGHAPPAEAPWATVDAGSDRWWLAIAHAEIRPPWAAQHFDCALGTQLAARPRPALTRVMSRLLVDADAVTRRIAAQGHVRRPIAVVPGLEPCQRVTDAVRDSNSRPAGPAVVAAAYGELFAELAPDRADEVRFIARAIGRSRLVCRMNWTRDVDEAVEAGRSLYREAASSPGFAADLGAARAELEAARAEGLSNPGCAAERLALGSRPGAD